MSKDTMVTLSTKEQCRTKIHVWFGSKSNHIHNCVEAIINCNDEIVNNFKSGTITVTLSDDCKTMSILDTGRGMRLGDVTNRVPNHKLYFETLFSSTNYDNIKSQKITGGTNGIANTVICQTSKSFIAEAWYDGTHYTVIYNDGDLCEDIKKEKCDTSLHGTKITFTSSEEVYTTNVFNVEDVKALCHKLAGISNTIAVIFKHNDEEVVYTYEKYEDYMDAIEINKISKQITFNEKEFVEDTGERNSIKCLLSLSTEPVQQTFLNYIHLKENGSIYDGVIDGIRKFCQKNISDKKTKLTTQDIEMSFNILCTVMSTNVEYASQMKFSTAKQLYKKLVSEYIVSNMEIFKAENPQEFDKILKHLQQINSFNTKNENSVKKIKKELSEKANTCTTRPEKLVPCRSKNPSEISIAFLEGDSALNSVKLSRDSRNTMVYPLKGKPINAMKSSLNKILSNQEIIDMYKIFGCGMEYNGKSIKGIDKFNMDKLQVNEILIVTDFDEDGMHLQTLLIGDIYTLSPQLIKSGKVKILMTPLYIIKTKDEEFFAYSELDRKKILSSITVPYKETRYKGIGGLSVDVMHKCLDLKTRKVITLTMEDGERSVEKLKLFLEEDILPRKNYISENAKDYSNIELYI